MQRVQTRARTRVFPRTIVTLWRLGSQRRRVLLCAWLTLFPVPGPFPQISHFFDMMRISSVGPTAGPERAPRGMREGAEER
jgi:hypothetical protein